MPQEGGHGGREGRASSVSPGWAGARACTVERPRSCVPCTRHVHRGISRIAIIQKHQVGTSFPDQFASFKGLIIYTSGSNGAGYFGRGFQICVMAASSLFLEP